MILLYVAIALIIYCAYVSWRYGNEEVSDQPRKSNGQYTYKKKEPVFINDEWKESLGNRKSSFTIRL